MGGRGTFAAGNIVPYTYKTVGTIDGVKVLEPIDEKSSHKIPVENHSSNSYIILDKKNSVFRQYRKYNEDHLPVFEIGYHFESGLSEKGENVFHIHEYTKPGIEHRQKGRMMTPDEINKYRPANKSQAIRGIIHEKLTGRKKAYQQDRTKGKIF